MPDLDTTLHLRMFRSFKRKNWLLIRLLKAIKREIGLKYFYGLEWGDPDTVEPLIFIKRRFVLPFINPEQCVVEIGPGGGRWTNYLLGFKKLYVVDYHLELLNELKKNFNLPNMVFVKNNGTNFPCIEPRAVDYVFSFGTFVHFDAYLIEAYLENLKSIIKVGANIVIQYSDKTKIMAKENKGFSDNTPDKMREMVLNKGYKIVDEDLSTLWNSSIIHFTM